MSEGALRNTLFQLACQVNMNSELSETCNDFIVIRVINTNDRSGDFIYSFA